MAWFPRANKWSLINGAAPSGEWSHIVAGGAVQDVSFNVNGDAIEGLEIYGEITNAIAGDIQLSLQFNGLATNQNIVIVGAYNGSTYNGANTADLIFGVNDVRGTGSAGRASFKLEMDSTRSGAERWVHGKYTTYGSASTAYAVGVAGGIWTATTAITSVSIHSSSAASIANGSRFKVRART